MACLTVNMYRLREEHYRSYAAWTSADFDEEEVDVVEITIDSPDDHFGPFDHDAEAH